MLQCCSVVWLDQCLMSVVALATLSASERAILALCDHVIGIKSASIEVARLECLLALAPILTFVDWVICSCATWATSTTNMTQKVWISHRIGSCRLMDSPVFVPKDDNMRSDFFLSFRETWLIAYSKHNSYQSQSLWQIRLKDAWIEDKASWNQIETNIFLFGTYECVFRLCPCSYDENLLDGSMPIGPIWWLFLPVAWACEPPPP